MSAASSTMELPRALQPWAEPLALLDPVAHDGLGRWLHPLRNLLGPMARPRASAQGEPDGYAGLSRRGPYERLLLSEWAVALELPDEFLRRAAGGEHVFVAPAFHEPHAASTSVALLDAGPRQLGAPRLAQLAVLVVLAQRAREGGASFRFGVLQDDERIVAEPSPPTLARWLASGSWRLAAPGADAWAEPLARLDAPDAWLVGTAELRPHAQRLGTGLLEVDEITHEGAPALRVCARPRGQGARAVVLPLPPPALCVQILRAPLARPPRRSPALDDASVSTDRLGQLSLDGRRWILPRADGSVAALHVPNTVKEQPGRAKVVMPRPGGTVLAVDMKGKRPVALAIADDGELLLRGSGLALGEGPSGSIGEVRRTGVLAPDSWLEGPDGLLTMFVTQATARTFSAWILDHAAQLWELRLDVDPRGEPTTQAIMPRDRACRVLWRLDAQTVAWISDSQERVSSSRALPGGDHPLTETQREHCVLGPLLRVGYHREALRFAVPEHDVLCVYDFGSTGLPELRLPLPAGRPIGLHASSAGPREWGLVPLHVSLDARSVCMRRPTGGDELLLSTAAPIDAIRYEPACDRFVWRTEHGELGVYDVGRKQVLLRLLSYGAAETEP